jgi:Zn-dependent peptidase ImmA (M78 family)/transcriptional regulator with XRE-family HTH domain
MGRFMGERLRLARLFHALSQEDLGEAIRSTRQFVHQLESGARKPSTEVAAALAYRLGVTSEFLHSPMQTRVQNEQTHFRKRRTTPVGIAEQVLAFGTLFEELVTLVNACIDLPPVNFPTFEPLGPESIEAAAAACRKHWALTPNAPIANMLRVLEGAGAVVTTFSGISEKVDALSMSRARPLIVLNLSRDNPPRRRFDLAHECGHVVLHQGIETGNPLREAEADQFASAFLLPRVGFASEFDAVTPWGEIRWPALYALKQRWGVSVRAIVYRAHKLGLLNPIQYRRANVYLSKTGQTKGEQLDELVANEQPELLSAALRMMRTDLGISYAAVAEKLGVSMSVLRLLSALPLVEDDTLKAVTNISLRKAGD